VIDKFGEVDLGEIKVKEVHISSRNDFEGEDGQRMKRDLFKQIKDSKATYACESKIYLAYDDF